MNKTIQDKAALRALMRTKRENLPASERCSLSVTASKHLIDAECWEKASCVALYIAVKGEADTEFLLENAWTKGKKVMLPLCRKNQKGVMDFLPCPGIESLSPGAYGIPEPSETGYNTPDLLPDIIVLPGIAFDISGTRWGQGGGYYDRLLARPEYANCLRLGLAYDFQVVPHLTRDTWDLPVDGICTEKGLLWIAKN